MHDIVLDKLNRLMSAYEPMEKVREIKIKYQVLLFEPRLLFRYKKNWIAYLIAFILYNSYKTQTIKVEDIRRYIEQIRAHDIELAENIRKILPIVENHNSIFADLINALRQGKEYFTLYISTHLNELISKAKSIEDAKLSKKLVALFSSISGHEVEYLVRYRNDCDNWGNYVIGNGIVFSIRRLNLYIKGGFENNTQFMGLYKDFGDAELTTLMLQNNAIKNLWRFNEQLRYLNLLIELCRKSETSGKWEGFYGADGFWGKEGDAKGKNFDRHANEFQTKYGNKDFADILIAQKGQIGENPEGWGGVWQGDRLVKPGFLQQLQARLLHPSYQRQKIIIPASLVLHEILKGREDELVRGRDKYLAQLIQLLLELTGIGINKEKVIKNFERLLRRKKRHLFNNLNAAHTEFASRASATLQEYDKYIKAVNQALAKIAPEFIEGNRINLLSSALLNLSYLRNQLPSGKFANGKITYMRMMYADKAAEEADIREVMLIRLEHLDEEDLRRIEELIKDGRNLMTRLRIVYDYIKSRLEKDFATNLDNIPATDFSAIANRTFDLGYIKLKFDDELRKVIIQFQQREKVR